MTKLVFISSRRVIFTLCCFSLLATPLAFAHKASYNLQSTLTSGTNNGTKETYTGLWLNVKKNIGLNRHSLISLKGKIGTKSYKANTSPNTGDLDLKATYLYQPSSGFSAPLYSASITLKQETFDSNIESSKKKSLSLFRSQPFGNKLKLAVGYKFEQETGKSSIDSQHLIFNADYAYSLNSLLYFNVRLADEEQKISTTTTASTNNFSARAVVDTAGGHLPGEGGHAISTTASSNNVFNSSNSSISIGTIYTLNDKHSFDIALIKHFYKVTSLSSNSTTNSSSSYLALDYFYNF